MVMLSLFADLAFGAIISSVVVHAIDAFPQYSDAIVQGTPPTCIAAIDTAIRALDALLTTDDGRLHALLYVANVSRKGSVRVLYDAMTMMHLNFGAHHLYKKPCKTSQPEERAHKCALSRVPATLCRTRRRSQTCREQRSLVTILGAFFTIYAHTCPFVSTHAA